MVIIKRQLRCPLNKAPSYGAKELDILAESLGARLIVHGLHHSQYSAILDCGIAVVGLGLAQLAMLDMEAFKAAENANEIIAAFEFGKIRERGGDSSNS